MDMDDMDTSPAVDIVGSARSALGSLAWKRFGVNNGIPAGVSKNHQFVADTLDTAGLGFDGPPPSAADWADPGTDIPGWPVVDGPAQAGDVLAMPQGKPDHWYFQPGQQMGIATGDDTSLGIRNNNQIAESDWGFRDDDNPTIRRHESLMADDGPQTASPPSSVPPPEPPKSGLSPETRRTIEQSKGPPPPGQGLWEMIKGRLADPPQRLPSDRY